jgi:DNA-directed RNA polymerase subunit beta'
MLVNSPSDFSCLEIGLASPDKIRFWSHGEVEKPETINYRTFKPERRGLFCEKIFGPVKDWECSCGKYRRVRYRGIVCERCGVEVTHSKVRRERMGHIELAADVTHIWFLKGIPSYIGIILDMSSRQLEEVVYYDSYIITEIEPELEGELAVKDIISAGEYERLIEKFGDKFKAKIGASAIKDLLGSLDLPKLVADLRIELDLVKGQKRLKITKRLKVLEAVLKSGNKPEWMVLEVIPVMPPDLRPMVQLEGGRFATSDLNDLYRRVVNRNNRLKRLIDIGAPEMIIRNEKRMLQESVDVLISNGKRGRSVTGSNGRPLKSLGNIIEGKQGRFRQNLLGKRVDYSARSVIVVGPQLKFYQCGLPKEMALELFKPFVIRSLVSGGHVTNVKTAKRKIEKRDVVVWDVLEQVIKGQPVLLNRAPTLHRLGIQAFEPVLVEGSAIQIHPLVCTAFNADFDGDQMAVHVPLSIEAQTECRLLIMSTNNILAPSNGRSIVTPTQDMVLGIYNLTIEDPDLPKIDKKCFKNVEEARCAWETGFIKLQQLINVRIDGKRIITTMGRIIFNNAIWEILVKHDKPKGDLINQVIGKGKLSDLVFDWFMNCGNDITVALLDELKRIGFKYSTLSGISISLEDLKIPGKKKELLENAEKEAAHLEGLVKTGALTEREKVLRLNDLWREVTQAISDELEKELGRLNNVFIMANSGARGNIDQVRQLAGMRGLMSDSQGRIMNIPITSNFKEGLSLTDYFISCYGARKGLVDTALRTADSGYLTRRLVDVAHNVTIMFEDCGDENGLEVLPIKDGVKVVIPLWELVEGKYCLEKVVDPKTKKVIAKIGDLLTVEQSKEIQELGKDSLKIRSPITCLAKQGVCQKCYGVDLSSGRLVNIGEAVGIIAAQSIGEPGTQLTMRTFHTGGVDLRKSSKVEVKAKKISGTVEMSEDLPIIRIKEKSGAIYWLAAKDGNIFVNSKKINKKHFIPKGSLVLVKPDETVAEDQVLAEYDPTFEHIFSDGKGVVRLYGMKLGERHNDKGKVVDIVSENDGEIFIYDIESMSSYEVPSKNLANYKKDDRIIDNTELASGVMVDVGGVITKIKQAKKKDHSVVDIARGKSYPVLAGSSVYINEGTKVNKNDVIAKERKGDADASKTKDIVQGLPRVEELFEARKSKDGAMLSDLNGVVDIKDEGLYRLVTVLGEESKKDYKIAHGVRLIVYAGKRVAKGDLLSEGTINPHDVLATRGVFETQKYLSEEAQKVYRSQGVKINSKHVEVIVRQMTRKINIQTSGDSPYLPNEIIDINKFNDINIKLEAEGKAPCAGLRVLLGITRAALNTDSFISASSFQQTASVLTKAATEGQRDPMFGLKENVIIGKLIPAGTGMNAYKNVGFNITGESDNEELEESEIDMEVNVMSDV